MIMKRGDTYFIDLNPVVGSEQGGIRPAVIVQNDIGNEHSTTTIVALMTTKLPTHVKTCQEDKPLHTSVILTEQIRTIDKKRIKRFICRLCDATMEKVDKALKISLSMNEKENKKEAKQMENGLQVFNNEEIGLQVRTILNDDGSISVNAEDTAIGFGWTQKQYKEGKEYVSIRWERMNGFSEECGFPHKWGKDDYIPESLFYRLGMKASNAAADKFQNWIAMEVIPSIRKTGSYQFKRLTPEEMMRIQLGMFDGHEERLTKLENTMNIDYGQQRVLEKEVAKVVIDSLGGKDSPAYREMSNKVFAECNHDVKDYFHVNSRNNIPRVRFDEAVDYIRNWRPCTNTEVRIREINEGKVKYDM